ncbi:MAG TPA: hypothetical protein VNW92_17650 [Polyangiaceae bacterium]|jgi:hypothetical protein|nr:hypothetical protein [Polyangiaceae bacterium]
MTDSNDPPRLAESRSGRLGALFLAASADIATEQELASLAARLGPALGFAPALVHGASIWAKIGSAVALSALGAGGALYMHSHAATTAGSLAAPTTAQTAPAAPRSVLASDANGWLNAPAREPAPVTVEAPVSSAATTATTPHATPAHPASARVDEATLLEHARSELASNPAHALQLTAEHAKNYPGGILAQEREVIAIAALRRLGRTAEAEQRAEVFDRTYPNSAHQRSVAANPANADSAK